MTGSEPERPDEIGRVLAFDYGQVRTGVAVSDPTGLLVRPLELIRKANSSDGLAKVRELVASYDVTRIVVGLPTGLSGAETTQTARSRSFAARLRTIVDVPVDLHDERFTSKLADQTSRLTGTDASRDSLAACHLLESWMEARRG